MMRFFFSVMFLVTASFVFGQDNNWLLGGWKGRSYLPGSDAFQHFQLTLKVLKIKGNKFEGIVSTMEPYDTTIRYDTKVSGEVFSNYLTIRYGKVLYAKNSPETKWILSCTNCRPQQMIFSMDKQRFSFKGTTDDCYPPCNGTSEFWRVLDEISSKNKEEIAALVKDDKTGKETNATTEVPLKKDTVTEQKLPPVQALELPEDFDKRKITTVRTIPVDTDSITVRVYDNGVIDGDIVSVVYNGRVVIEKLSLTSNVTTLKLAVNPSGINKLVFYAHNLGDFPPNTARLEILHNAKKEELVIASDYTVSSAVNIVFGK